MSIAVPGAYEAPTPQIVIGLAVTKEGIPVRCWCWAGNTTDATVLPEVKDRMRAWRLGRVVTVVDHGFSSEANLQYLKRVLGTHAEPVRRRAGATTLLRRPGLLRA